ncbi:MAG: SDR family oxidoreductase [Hyphomicrobium zavarzinii]|nr:SDR family oxidoreductase [Hyphomicrobium zavarzinii]
MAFGLQNQTRSCVPHLHAENFPANGVLKLSEPMSNFFVSLADLWIRRAAAPKPEAFALVRDLSPAVVITGASRGIGRALAQRFAEAGHDLVLIARAPDPLEKTVQELSRSTKSRVVPLALDVTAPDAPQRLDAALAAAGFYMDVLVNNAGIGLSGPFVEQEATDIERLIALNVTAATRLMHHALPAMLARARGGILNVGSLGGLVPGPNQAAYYASKAYLISLTEAVGHEVRGRGVRLSVVAPGPVETTFHRSMRAEGALYRTLVPSMSAEAVARSSYRGYRIGRTVIVPGVLPALNAIALKFLPHALSVPLVGFLLSNGSRRAS